MNIIADLYGKLKSFCSFWLYAHQNTAFVVHINSKIWGMTIICYKVVYKMYNRPLCIPNSPKSDSAIEQFAQILLDIAVNVSKN